MKFIVIVFILVIILFIPIPIKFIAHYSKNIYYLKLYKITLFSNNGGVLRKFCERRKKKKSYTTRQKVDSEKKTSENNKQRNLSFSKIYTKFSNNKFKPNLKFSLFCEYDLSDAATTAICYGLINNLNFIINCTFSVIFKLRKFKMVVKPLFINEFKINFTIEGIITFNIAQIIYMLFLLRKSNKEVPLL